MRFDIPIDKRTALFFGDSIISGYESVVSWPCLLAPELNFWAIVDGGIAGTVLQSTNHLLNNGQERILPLMKRYCPEIVYIQYGSNDMRLKDKNFTFLSYQASLEHVVKTIRSSVTYFQETCNLRVKDSIDIVISSIPYMNPDFYNRYAPYNDASTEKIEKFRDITKNVADQFQCSWANVYDEMLSSGGNIFIAPDGFHPNADGHHLMKEVFKKATPI